MILVVTSTTRPPFLRDDLGIVQVRRREALGGGRGTTFARYMQDDLRNAVPMQQGVSIVRQLITGKKRNIPTADRLQALEQHVGVLLVAFTYHKGGHQAPYRCKSDPYPRIAIER